MKYLTLTLSCFVLQIAVSPKNVTDKSKVSTVFPVIGTANTMNSNVDRVSNQLQGNTTCRGNTANISETVFPVIGTANTMNSNVNRVSNSTANNTTDDANTEKTTVNRKGTYLLNSEKNTLMRGEIREMLKKDPPVINIHKDLPTTIETIKRALKNAAYVSKDTVRSIINEASAKGDSESVQDFLTKIKNALKDRVTTNIVDLKTTTETFYALDDEMISAKIKEKEEKAARKAAREQEKLEQEKQK